MRDSSIKLLKTLYGTAGENFAKTLEASHPEFAMLVDDFVLGQVWSRTGLPAREKSLITVSAEIALERWDQVELQMRSFLHIGGTVDDLREILIHLTVYCGFPVAITAFGILESIQRSP
jgi:4-carboxymuconolactone decarboxylase